MEIFNKNVELQIDKKPMGRVIRVNVNGVCKVRICQIPEKYFPKETDESNLIDITLNEEKIREGRTMNPQHKKIAEMIKKEIDLCNKYIESFTVKEIKVTLIRLAKKQADIYEEEAKEKAKKSKRIHYVCWNEKDEEELRKEMKKYFNRTQFLKIIGVKE